MATRSKCGTYGGYQTHIQNKEMACRPCKDSKKEYSRLWKLSHPTMPKERIISIPECGTYAKYKYHYRRKEEICQPCRDALNAYHRSRIEKTHEYKTIWRENNRDKTRQWHRAHRALRKHNGHIPYSEQDVLNLYGEICHICKEKIDMDAPRMVGTPDWQMGLHFDHLIPISKGGSDTLENVRPSHGICNLQKGTKSYLYSKKEVA